MESRKLKRNIIIAAIVIIITALNYSRLTGTENIRLIHELTLITMGMGIGVMIVNIMLYFKSKQKD
ncbi:MAG TPA: hypothetical protein VIL99_06620 [Ignavibacteria bacterium]|jgi:hypothetical protein